MAKTGTKKLEWYSVPLDKSVFGDKTPNASARAVMSVIRNLSYHDSFASFSYLDIMKRYRLSRASAGRALKAVRDSEKFARGKRVREYKYIFPDGYDENDEEKEKFVKVQDWLHRARIAVEGETRYMSGNEAYVLSYIRGFSPNGISATIRFIARQTMLAVSTVYWILQRLNKAGLIRIENPKGRTVNGYTRTRYTAEEGAIKRLKKITLEPLTGKADAPDERAERERVYSARRAAEAAG